MVVATISDGAHTGPRRMRPLRALRRERRGRGRGHRGLRAGHRGAGSSRAELPALLPPGAARNALDCALWDFEAKRAGRSAAALAGLGALTPVLDGLHHLARHARSDGGEGARGGAPIRCSSSSSAARAMRSASPPCARRCRRRGSSPMPTRPGKPHDTESLLAAAAAAGVELIEQPLPAGKDASLAAIARPFRSAPTSWCMTAPRSTRSPRATTR